MKQIQEQVPSTIGYSASAAATPLLLGPRSYYLTSLGLSNELAKAGAAPTSASATNTVQAGTLLRLTLYGVVLEPGDAPIAMYPTWLSNQYSPSQTFPGFGARVVVVNGMYLRRTTFMTLLGAANA